jgi:centrosomal protein CEP104
MSETKLHFELVYASSEDAAYPATELNAHSPQTRGWQSARFCEYPQELGLWFPDGAVAISQVQLLSHQSKIATKIELSVGVGGSYEDAKFTRLGYLSLDSNERSGHKVRRLPRW